MTTTAPDEARARQWLAVAIAAITLLALLLRLRGVDLFYMNVHASRDLYRAFLMARGIEFPLFGPELNYGGRSLGPAVYFLYAPPFLFTKDPLWASAWVALVNALAVPPLMLACRRLLAVPACCVAGLLLAVSPLAAAELRYMWNPVFVLPLSCLLLWLAVITQEDPRPWRWALLALVGAALVQVHLSTALVVLVAWGFVAARLRRQALGGLKWALPVLAICFLPFLLGKLLQPGDFFGTWKTPEVRDQGIDFLGFNPNAFWVAGELVAPDSGESILRGLFTHFVWMRANIAEASPALARLVATEDLWAWLGRALLLLGMGLAAAAVARRGQVVVDVTDFSQGDNSRRALLLLLLLWLLVPVLLYMWWSPFDWRRNGYLGVLPEVTEESQPPSYLAKRYLYQCWPAIFALMALGFEWLWRWPLWRMATGGVLAGYLGFQALFTSAWVAVAEHTGSGIVHVGVMHRPTPTWRTSMEFARALRETGELGTEDLNPRRLRTGVEYGFNIMELDLDYPLRLAFEGAPARGRMADDEVMTIRRVFPLWPGLEPLRSYQAGRFEGHVVTREQADQFILFSDDWLQPYWPGVGKTWLWGEGE